MEWMIGAVTVELGSQWSGSQCATGNLVPVRANPATFKEIRFRSVPAKSLNIDQIQPDFILILRQHKFCSNLFFHLNILLSVLQNLLKLGDF